MAIACIPFVFPGIKGVRCAFQIRTEPNGGNPDLADNISLSIAQTAQTVSNREALARACGLEELAEVRQVHGDHTVFGPTAASRHADPVTEADGMATDTPGIGLMIKTADCQPVMLAHRSGQYVAALHVGWRGNRAGYPGKAVREFCEYYTIRPQDVFAVRGPSLGPAHARFTRFAEEWGDAYAQWFDQERGTMDLWSLTRSQLVAAGLPDSHIMGVDMCTFSMPGHFYSYRRDHGCGRQGSVIWIEK